MAEKSFEEKFKARFRQNLHVGAGFDFGIDEMPPAAQKGTQRDTLIHFYSCVYQLIKDHICAIKLHPAAFYGPEGNYALHRLLSHFRNTQENVPLIWDGNYADVPHIMEKHARYTFKNLECDAVTVRLDNGKESIEPFLQYQNRFTFILVKGTNQGSNEEDFLVLKDNSSLLRWRMLRIAEWFKEYINFGIVFAANKPLNLCLAREELKYLLGRDVVILALGIGPQGKKSLKEQLVRAARAGGKNTIYLSSRGIVQASQGPDFAQQAGVKAQEMNAIIRSLFA